MQKYSFYNDYSEGAHPRILELIQKTNLAQEPGYGYDSLCRQAQEFILERVQNPQAQVFFVPGGTQANLIVLASLLRPHESVIAAVTAHICVHETGAIEATGHKINAVVTPDGKLTPAHIQAVVDGHNDEHMVKPAAVFISHSTELGTVYHKAELEAIARTCLRNGLSLYLDGARLASALTCRAADVSLADLGRLVDVFYIGGTKNGALLGEAIVINDPALQKDFRYVIKQRGGLLAKGRLIGAQFVSLFQDDLYFELAASANRLAQKLAEGIRALGYGFLTDSPTNQIFPVFPNDLIVKLEEDYGFYRMDKLDADHTAIRLVTSWATKEEAVDEFLRRLSGKSGA